MAKRNPYLISLGQRISHMRHAAKLSQQQLAERAGLSIKGISEIERGVSNPSILVLRAVAQGLGVDVPRLIAEPGKVDLEIAALLAGASKREQAKALAVLKTLLSGSSDDP